MMKMQNVVNGDVIYASVFEQIMSKSQSKNSCVQNQLIIQTLLESNITFCDQTLPRG